MHGVLTRGELGDVAYDLALPNLHIALLEPRKRSRVVGIGPLGKALIKPLEDRFPPWDESRGPPAGIVVLGGAIDPDFAALHMPDLNDAAERVAVIPALAKAYPNARIVYSGGNARLGGGSGGSEAQYAEVLIEGFSRICLSRS